MKRITTKNGSTIDLMETQERETERLAREDIRIKGKDKNATQTQKLDYIIALLEGGFN